MNYLNIDENNLSNEQIKDIFYSLKKEKYECADYLIIYGCHIKKLLDERLEYALDILKRKKVEKILITGGIGKKGNFNECDYMLSFLLRNGIKLDRIVIENKSTTTEENNKNILQILKLNSSKKKIRIVLCTQEPHMVRILLHWNKLIHNSNVDFISDYPETSVIAYDNIIENKELKKELGNQVAKIKYSWIKGIYSEKRR